MQRLSTINMAAAKGVIAALLAILVGIGLSRFAYSPLIPAVIEARWFSQGEAAYLGAANLAGYLVGALGGRRLAAIGSSGSVLRLSMLAASIAFVASAFPLSFLWFLFWRLVSGVTGGVLMVLAAPTVLPLVPARKRGFAAGAIFAGVGCGIVLSGTLVPAMFEYGLPATWFGVALLSFAATGVAWGWWPAGNRHETGAVATPAGGRSRALRQSALIAIWSSYGLIAVGLVPHMVFLVDFIARGLGQGISVGGWYWVLFGIGALLGPLLAGRLADRLGFGIALRSVLVLHIFGVAILTVDGSAIFLVISSFVVGSAVSGTVPLVLGQVQERVPSLELQKTAWGIATAAFALGQASAGYAFSYLFAASDGDFVLLFLLGSAALVLALTVNLLAAISPAPASREAAR